MKLALIGGGYWGKNLIREFNNCGILHTICEINQETNMIYNQQYPEIKTTTDWKTVLNNKEIDSVCISLPAELHYQFARDALEHGKDVYVEKPITLDIKEAELLVKLAKDNSRILMVGHLLHYHGAIIKIKQLIKDGEIGKLKNITSNRFNLGKFRSQENVLWSFAPHDISVILSLCGDRLPDLYYASGMDHLQTGIHDVTNTIMIYNDEKIYVNINVNWLNPFKEQKLTIIGERGMIVFDDTLPSDKLRIYRNYVSWDQSTSPCPSPVKSDGEAVNYISEKSPLLMECQHFVECCQERKTPITDGEEGLRVLKVLTRLNDELSGNNSRDKITKPIDPNQEISVHPSATIDKGANIGNHTKIWHYSHVCNGAEIGENCNIGQNVFLAGGSRLGNNCKVQNNVSVYAGVECGDYVFLGPSCVLTNDINPRGMYSKGGEYIKTIIEDGVTVGANATIVCGNRIGRHALIGAGAVVTKDVDAYSIMVGNPAKKIGEINEKGDRKIY